MNSKLRSKQSHTRAIANSSLDHGQRLKGWRSFIRNPQTWLQVLYLCRPLPILARILNKTTCRFTLQPPGTSGGSIGHARLLPHNVNHIIPTVILTEPICQPNVYGSYIFYINRDNFILLQKSKRLFAEPKVVYYI